MQTELTNAEKRAEILEKAAKIEVVRLNATKDQMSRCFAIFLKEPSNLRQKCLSNHYRMKAWARHHQQRKLQERRRPYHQWANRTETARLPLSSCFGDCFRLALVVFARATRDAEASPTLQDHWHAAYGVWDCVTESFLTPFQSEFDPEGYIHTKMDSYTFIHSPLQ